MKTVIVGMAVVGLTVSLAGCSGSKNTAEETENGNSTTDTVQAADSGTSTAQAPASEVTELAVQFGDEGTEFMMHLEDNDTAATIASYVGTSDWRLPIYENDEDVDYSVLQYYDIPSRYEIPSEPQAVTEAKAGDVYYSDPNRIVLFYHDASD